MGDKKVIVMSLEEVASSGSRETRRIVRNAATTQTEPDLLGLVDDVQKAVSKLSDKEMRLIRMLYGLGTAPYTRKEAANYFGITQAAVEKLEKQALAGLADETKEALFTLYSLKEQ